MPYVIEHAARVREPSEYRERTFRRDPLTTTITVMVTRGGKKVPRKKQVPIGITLVEGKLKGGGTSMVVQAYRFDKTMWTPAQAKAWLKKEGIIFIRFDVAKKQYAKAKKK